MGDRSIDTRAMETRSDMMQMPRPLGEEPANPSGWPKEGTSALYRTRQAFTAFTNASDEPIRTLPGSVVHASYARCRKLLKAVVVIV
jgi:hypothetical protein